MEKRVNKYIYYVVLQANYGYGWDDLTYYDTAAPGWMKELKSDRRAYRENCAGLPLRTIRRRELNK